MPASEFAGRIIRKSYRDMASETPVAPSKPKEKKKKKDKRDKDDKNIKLGQIDEEEEESSCCWNFLSIYIIN